MHRGIRIAVIGSVLFMCGSALMADAAAIRVRCVQRPGRSKVSVDASGLAPGNYRAKVVSGANRVSSGFQSAVGDEVEFDFDSNPANVAAGATAIAPNFIQGGEVKGKILDAVGRTVAMDIVDCQIKN